MLNEVKIMTNRITSSFKWLKLNVDRFLKSITLYGWPNSYHILINWGTRILLYLVLFMIIIIVSPIILDISNVDNSENSRYMISALIQGEASILALVITLTIISVQQASSYSPRIMDIFKYRNPDLWIVVVSYILIMVYGLRVLLQIDDRYIPLFRWSYLSDLPINLDPILLTYYYSIFAFVALIFYTWHTLDLLRPTKIIDLLAEKITTNNILSKKDPIQPIVDIISYFMIDKHDNEITKRGLKIIEDKITLFFKSTKFTELSSETTEIQNIIKIIEESDDESVTLKNIKTEHNYLLLIYEDKNDESEKSTLISKTYNLWKDILGDVNGSTDNLDIFLNNKDEDYKKIMNFICSKGNEYDVFDKIYLQLVNLGAFATKEANYEIVDEVTRTVGIIGGVSAKNNLKYPLGSTITSLEKIGILAVNQKMNYSIAHIIELFDKMQVELYYNSSMATYSYPLITESINNIYSSLREFGNTNFVSELKNQQSQRLLNDLMEHLMENQNVDGH